MAPGSTLVHSQLARILARIWTRLSTSRIQKKRSTGSTSQSSMEQRWLWMFVAKPLSGGNIYPTHYPLGFSSGVTPGFHPASSRFRSLPFLSLPFRS